MFFKPFFQALYASSEQVYGVASKDVARKGRVEESSETAFMLSEEPRVDV